MSNKNYFMPGPISPQFIGEQIAHHDSKCEIGAHSIFLGQVRADKMDGKTVSAIEYSAYEEMALNEISKIKEKAIDKWPLTCLHIYHSIGEVKAGEISLLIFVSSGHRKECIDAMTEIVEDVKHNVPIWKQEILEDKSTRWVQD